MNGTKTIARPLSWAFALLVAALLSCAAALGAAAPAYAEGDGAPVLAAAGLQAQSEAHTLTIQQPDSPVGTTAKVYYTSAASGGVASLDQQQIASGIKVYFLIIDPENSSGRYLLRDGFLEKFEYSSDNGTSWTKAQDATIRATLDGKTVAGFGCSFDMPENDTLVRAIILPYPTVKVDTSLENVSLQVSPAASSDWGDKVEDIYVARATAQASFKVKCVPDPGYRLTRLWVADESGNSISEISQGSFDIDGGIVYLPAGASGILTLHAEVTDSTEADVIISSSAELASFTEGVGSGNSYLGKLVQLSNDIDMSGTEYQTAASCFMGVFDGCGHAVSGIDKPLFNGIGNGAVVRDLTLKGDITTEYTGAIAPFALAAEKGGVTIENCVNYCSVTNVSTGTASSASGIVGSIARGGMTLVGCKNYGEITSTNMVAGLVVSAGGGDNKITSCANYGHVVLAETQGMGYASGIVGIASNGAVVSGCVNKGAVEARNVSNGAYVAGVLAVTASTSTPKVAVNNCYNMGAISISLAEEVIPGSLSGTMVSGVALFTGFEQQYAATNPIIFKNCYNAGEVSCENDVAQAFQVVNDHLVWLGMAQSVEEYWGVTIDNCLGRDEALAIEPGRVMSTLSESFRADTAGINPEGTPVLYWEAGASADPADDVAAAIAAIGTGDEVDEAAVQAALDAYNALETDEQKARVAGLSALFDAQQKLAAAELAAAEQGRLTAESDAAAQGERAKAAESGLAAKAAEVAAAQAQAVAAQAKAQALEGQLSAAKAQAAQLTKDLSAAKAAQGLKANPMTAKAKTVKAKAGKKKTVKKSKAFTVKNAKGKVTFYKLSGDEKITVTKAGKVKVKAGLKAKKKAYKVKVLVCAAGDKDHTPAFKTVTLKVKVS